MNIVLFASESCRQSLPVTDHRARHLLEVLKCQPGSRFRAGVVNGPSGLGTVVAIEREQMRARAACWATVPAPPTDITLIVGLPRPPSAAKILYQGAAIGCRAIHFVHTGLSDRNYAMSRLWQRAEWRRHVLDGAQQSAATTVPEVTCGEPLLALCCSVSPRVRDWWRWITRPVRGGWVRLACRRRWCWRSARSAAGARRIGTRWPDALLYRQDSARLGAQDSAGRDRVRRGYPGYCQGATRRHVV